MVRLIIICIVWFWCYQNYGMYHSLDGETKSQEEIKNFSVAIDIQSDGKIKVSETITFRVTNRYIKRGIYRQLPLYQENNFGLREEIRYENIQILHNYSPVLWTSHLSEDTFLLRIGDANRTIPPGEHVYTIIYEIKDQIRFFDSYDELYWNATGNSWNFPIEEVEVKIKLPRISPSLNTACYTGPIGSTEKKCSYSSKDEFIFFQADGLGIHEGLTVAVGFDKGLVKPTSFSLEEWVNTYAFIPISILLALLMAFYYWSTWYVLGKYYKTKHRVIPIYSAPEHISPSMARALFTGSTDHKTIVVALVNLAVHNIIRIVYTSFDLTLSRTHNVLDTDAFAEEKVLVSYLFTKGKNKVLNAIFDEDLFRANHEVKYEVETEMRKRKYFKSTFVFELVGGTLTTLFLMYAWTHFIDEPYRQNGVPYILGIYICSFLGSFVSVKSLSFKVFTGIQFFIAFELFTSLEMPVHIWMLGVTLIVLCIVVHRVYISKIKYVTKNGQKDLEIVHGLLMYLTRAETYRYENLTPPRRTLELFEELLPYAMALNVTNTWASFFSFDIIQSSSIRHMFSRSNSETGWSTSLENRISQSMTKSVPFSTSPSRWTGSSGSSGSGSSGGGSGGGGGGGW